MNTAYDLPALLILLAAVLMPVPAQIALRSVLRTVGLSVQSGHSSTGGIARILYRLLFVGLTCFAGTALWSGEMRAGCEALVAILCLSMLATDARWYWLPLPLTLAFFSSGLMLAASDGLLVERLSSSAAVMIALETLRTGFRYWRGIEALGGGDVILGAGLAAHAGLMETGLIFTVAAVSALLFFFFFNSKQGTTKTPLGAWLCLAYMPVIFGLSYS